MSFEIIKEYTCYRSDCCNALLLVDVVIRDSSYAYTQWWKCANCKRLGVTVYAPSTRDAFTDIVEIMQT